MSLAVLLASRAATLGLQNAVNVVLEMPLTDWSSRCWVARWGQHRLRCSLTCSIRFHPVCS